MLHYAQYPAIHQEQTATAIKRGGLIFVGSYDSSMRSFLAVSESVPTLSDATSPGCFCDGEHCYVVEARDTAEGQPSLVLSKLPLSPAPFASPVVSGTALFPTTRGP